ncbi:hypothetical protein [Kitasatospora sp. NBC_00240]|uniref:hypothetical protein n=1 Tax=Kitasatospora sp. NBC_00240 TaxID=2903567 RepID=UPI002250AF1C|nr:hypothetical protein [Kitasatospora sp. NBC_00240]
MSPVKRFVGAGVAVFALLTGGISMAPAASAMTTQTTCSSVDGGRLCLTRSDAGYNASFLNRSAYPKRLHFYLVCKSFRPGAGGTALLSDRGSFISYPNHVNSFFFNASAVPAGGICYLGMSDLTSGVVRQYRTTSL